MERNIALYPWFQACRSLLFWQAVWFLYFQGVLSAGEAIVLAAIYDIASSALEVPSGYLSDRIGRRLTLILAMIATISGCLMIGLGAGFYWFALGQVLLGAGTAFNSGTDSALLYDSLLESGRQDDVAQHELKAWRYSFSGLAISAFVGGLISVDSAAVSFIATAITGCLALGLVVLFREPRMARGDDVLARTAFGHGTVVLGYFKQPALVWLFGLSVAMYIFSHVPFVFAQPFIAQMLAGVGLASETTIVSGSVVAVMMLVSVAAGWVAEPLQRRLGTSGILLLAFAMQIGLIAVLMISTHPAAIAILLIRMVPGAFSRPFILASVHPRIESAYRATYLSLQSLCGRIGLAGTLLGVSVLATGGGVLQVPTLQFILSLYVVVGLAVFGGLLFTSKALGRSG